MNNMYAKQLREIADKANKETAKKISEIIFEKIMVQSEIEANKGKYKLYLDKKEGNDLFKSKIAENELQDKLNKFGLKLFYDNYNDVYFVIW